MTVFTNGGFATGMAALFAKHANRAVVATFSFLMDFVEFGLFVILAPLSILETKVPFLQLSRATGGDEVGVLSLIVLAVVNIPYSVLFRKGDYFSNEIGKKISTKLKNLTPFIKMLFILPVILARFLIVAFSLLDKALFLTKSVLAGLFIFRNPFKNFPQYREHHKNFSLMETLAMATGITAARVAAPVGYVMGVLLSPFVSLARMMRPQFGQSVVLDGSYEVATNHVYDESVQILREQVVGLPQRFYQQGAIVQPDPTPFVLNLDDCKIKYKP